MEQLKSPRTCPTRATKVSNCFKRSKTFNRSFKQCLFAFVVASVIVVLLNPLADQDGCVEGKKLKKEKKVFKSLVKGLIFKNLSTKKNFLPLPVPIPVPIELSEPPVYIKGKPKYVTIYKPKPLPIVKPTTVYHMPVYSPTYEYMVDPSSIYNSMMLSDDKQSYDSSGHYNKFKSNNYKNSNNNVKNNYQSKHHSQLNYPKAQSAYTGNPASSAMSMINFTDYDDEAGNYYLKNGQKQQQQPRSASSNKVRYVNYSKGVHKRSDTQNGATISSAMQTSEQESLFDDGDLTRHHTRVKRQVYHSSSYENEPPCYGFPLEVNIKSRIKMDQLFPIHGNSQFKKCIKIPKPKLPQVEDDPSSAISVVTGPLYG